MCFSVYQQEHTPLIRRLCVCLWVIPALKTDFLSTSLHSEIVSTLPAINVVIVFFLWTQSWRVPSALPSNLLSLCLSQEAQVINPVFSVSFSQYHTCSSGLCVCVSCSFCSHLPFCIDFMPGSREVMQSGEFSAVARNISQFLLSLQDVCEGVNYVN